MWWVYIAECSDHSLYTGIALDPHARIAKHNAGKGAAFTRGRTPVVLRLAFSCVEEDGDFGKSEALRLEAAIKKLPRMKKVELLSMRGPMWTKIMSGTGIGHGNCRLLMFKKEKKDG